ncbi:unnamed protein product [Closterium sp. Naga37s-1]|nr:unnamed protein product [Closterium sp. Naga37s-1]
MAPALPRGPFASAPEIEEEGSALRPVEPRTGASTSAVVNGASTGATTGGGGASGVSGVVAAETKRGRLRKPGRRDLGDSSTGEDSEGFLSGKEDGGEGRGLLKGILKRGGGGSQGGAGSVGGSGSGGRFGSSLSEEEWKEYFKRSLTEIFMGSKLNVLMPFIVISIVCVQLEVSQGYIFLFSLLGIAPLAERLGYVTEQLALYTGPTLGGLLNATFGNATELIISVFALRNGMIRVVQLSLLGSILSNMLLVLGCAFYAGGLRYREQKFNKTAALVNSGLLLMAVMGLALPAILHSTHTEIRDNDSELALSRISSCIMLAAYGAYLYFQLKSHVHLYDENAGGDAAGSAKAGKAAVIGTCNSPRMKMVHPGATTIASPRDLEVGKEDDEEEEEEEEVLGLWGSIVWMGIVTIFIAILSEYLVDAIEGASNSWDMPVAFISVVILPIVGNAAEHASAIIFAIKNKLDIALGVAIGSSTQISMFAIPLCVVLGWAMGVPMDLNFHIFETATLFVTVLVVAALLAEGEANYFKGIMLVLSRTMAAVTAMAAATLPVLCSASRHFQSGASVCRSESTTARLTLRSRELRHQRLVVRAAKGGKSGSEEDEGPKLSSAERLAALEERLGKGKSTIWSVTPEPEPTPPPKAAEPVFRMSGEKSSFEKLVEAWLAKEGGLAKLNDFAYKAIFVLAGAWILFRFIGPATGLYSLEDSLFG